MKSKILILAIILTSSTIFSQLKASKIFSDYAILQQNQPIKIWGTHKKGKKIKVTFNNKTKKVRTNKDGNWMVKFNSLKGGYKPYTITITSGSEKITYKDILIGDVWLCSGQSNMEWSLYDTENAKQEIAKVTDKYIRHFKVPNSYATTPEKKLAGGSWEIASPKTVGSFTAVGYYFAKNIRKTQNIPVALLNSSWGGSRIEPWMSAKTLKVNDSSKFLEEIENKMNDVVEKSAKKLRANFPYLKEENIDYSSKSWSDKNIDTSDWSTLKVPGLWEGLGYGGFDGQAWYRTSVNLTKEEAANGINLGLAMIDDSDYVWVNGVKIGETVQRYDAKRLYTIDSKILVEGENTIVVKVDDTGGGGGIYGNEADLFVKTINQTISLAKPWLFKISSYRKPQMGVNQVPTMLYNKMIYPILNFPIKGAIWYQGESNANSIDDAKKYSTLFKDMINQWRSEWNVGNFPFLWVQLANFMETQDANTDSSWAHLRKSQSDALSLPNTAEAVIIDIGEAKDIHPRNKKDVGYRLSLGARKIAYNENLVFSGPTYKNHKIIGNTIEINFNHIGSGLKVKDKYGYVKGFTIAGDNNKFVWAKAKISGNKIIVWSDTVKNPKKVKYAWANNPDDANLYNKEDLPTSPFKTE